MIPLKHIVDINAQCQRLFDFAEHNDTVALDHELGELSILIQDARDAIDDEWKANRTTSQPKPSQQLEDLI